MTTVAFKIPGAPQGKGRARAFKTPGGHIGHYTPAKTRTYEGMIRTQAIEAMGRQKPIEGPVSLTMILAMPIPKSWPKWKRELAEIGRVLPTTKPDSDNVLKAVKDAVNGVIWKDDCQVCSATIRAHYAAGDELVGVYVDIGQMPAAPAQCDRKEADGYRAMAPGERGAGLVEAGELQPGADQGASGEDRGQAREGSSGEAAPGNVETVE